MEQTTQTQLPSKEQLQSCLGRRIEVQENVGTIKFAGPLAHDGKPENSEKQTWYGVEWDDNSRGKHNGVVNGYEYFKTRDNQNTGSLVKDGKGTLGISFLDGVFKKYFKDGVAEDLKQKIKDRIEGEQQQQQLQQDTPQTEEEQKEDEEKAKILIEFDEDAYFETKNKQKKMVEFYGFDKIWEKLNNIKELQEISLCQVQISDIGPQNYLSRLLPNLKVLSIEKNLFFDWDQIFQIGYELPNLQELQIARNQIREPENIDGRTTIKCFNSNKDIQQSPVGVFKRLKYLNFIEMGLNWDLICRILPAFPVLEDLILCINDMSDTQNIKLREQDLQNLSFLNLESANLSNFQGLQVFGNLPNLEKLILNKNKFQELGTIQQSLFEHVKVLALEKNLIENPKIFTEISQFKQLEQLNIKHNPMGETYGKSYVRQRAVAENPHLIFINGSDLKKYERKDCEIFYLRRTFDDYFKMRGSVYYDYDFEDFIKWSSEFHPSIAHLMTVYGNPYEQEPKQQNNAESEAIPKNIMIKLKIVIAAGPLLGKNPLNKKFPDNTTVQNMKNVFSKLLQIPGEQQIIYYKINDNDPMEILDEDHKTLSHYGIKDGSEITIGDK